MQQMPSTRWCPTPEQLMILEEMYRSGIRTPNASQIRQITAHLSYYGKIEGKNVFYWFQNHKARDRQKMRRRLSCLQQQQQQQHQNGQAGLLSHQIFHLELSPHPPPPPPLPPSLLPHLHFPYNPHHHHLRRHHPPQFLHPAASAYQQEPDNIPPMMNLVCKLEPPLCGKEAVDETMAAGKERKSAMMEEMGCSTTTLREDPCWRPLKTLDLFPTTTTGAGLNKDDHSISSSCSTSTTN